jgi:hypothetical protein
VSIGSKFAIVVLILPICLILAVLAVAYSVYPNPFLLALVAALPSATVFIWRELRTTLRAQMLDVWDRYLKQISDSASTNALWVGWNFYFPGKAHGLDSKLDEATRRGKYLHFKLYPTKLVKEKLVTKMLTLGENFNSKLEKIQADSRGGGFELNVAYAFDHWGLRKAPPDQPLRITPLDLMNQKSYLEGLDKGKKQEVNELVESWKEPLNLSKQIVSILDKFSSENGIMPPKPPQFLGGIA